MNITEKLMNIQSNLNAPKNQRNSFGNYNYRSCEDILVAVKPLLAEYKCTVTLNDDMVVVGDRIYVKATATLTDVEKPDAKVVNSAFAREAAVKKGQDESQITGATSSYARKYALNGLFLIDDNKDADTDEYKKENDSKAKATPKADKPTTPDVDKPTTPDVDKQKLKDIQVAFVNFCNKSGIDYHDYGMTTKSTYEDFEDALRRAKDDVAKKKAKKAAEESGGELPFPLDD